MPPACPVDRYVPCYKGQLRSALECHRLARWIVTFLATKDSFETPLNATGLPGGSLRSLLQRTASKRLECHRLARWIVTFLATQDSFETALNATGLPGGSLRSLLQGTASNALECHRLARWIVTFLATGDSFEAPECHRLARWIVTFLATVAENVSIHRASRWHYWSLRVSVCSNERNDPSGKPRAFEHGRPPTCHATVY